MKKVWSICNTRCRVALGMAMTACLGMGSDVNAQVPSTRLEEVIVTAQKRVQSVQDIPVAVTALTRETMAVNRVLDVNDLNGLAPNLTVRPAAGGTNIPAFNMRGITSYGVVAGSDKQISIYLDGVYIGSPRGSIFNLPDIQQLEVLRGPQGTLFGRNATGGAISIRTRDPAGQLQFRQEVSVGNRDHLGTETTIDFPSVGPFSAYLTYSQEERDGDIDNLGAGTTWDRTAFNNGTDTSPATLGAVDTESLFLSTYLSLDEVIVAYKFDYGTDEGTPRGNAIVTGLYPAALGPLGDSFSDLAANNPDLLTQGTARPDTVNNVWSLRRDQKVQGHNLYAEWMINYQLTLKNTLAHRKTEVFQPADISGTSGWVFGDDPGVFAFPGFPPPTDPHTVITPGTPFCYACSQSNAEGDQWSNELQLDYDGEHATIISGLLYYESEDESGSPRNSINTFIPNIGTLGVFPGYVVPRAGQAVSYNEAKSYAIYSQAEFHLTDEWDLLAGVRYTQDEKSGTFVTGLPEDPPLPEVDLPEGASQEPSGGYVKRAFNYDDDNIDYLIGLNYQLTADIMVYGKFSTAYVSGGSVAGFDFDPEEVESWELGAKADFLDSRLRTNIALFDATYENLQTAQAGANVEGAEGVSVLIIPGGELESRGAELEVSALPMEGLTLSANLGYVDNAFAEVTDEVLATIGGIGANAFPGSSYEQTLSPEWNGTVSLNYETRPLFDKAYLTVGLSGIWRDKMRLEPNPGRAAATPFGVAEFSPEAWVVNARAALIDIDLGGGWTGEVALWGRNLTDDDSLQFITNFGALASGTFEEERSYGVDFVVLYQ